MSFYFAENVLPGGGVFFGDLGGVVSTETDAITEPVIFGDLNHINQLLLIQGDVISIQFDPVEGDGVWTYTGALRKEAVGSGLVWSGTGDGESYTVNLEVSDTIDLVGDYVLSVAMSSGSARITRRLRMHFGRAY